MLSLWKLRVGAEDYYLSQVARGLDDYYTGQGEMPGRWFGNAASGLELSGIVAAEDLRAVLAGLRPGSGRTPNGESLRTWKGRVPGFDLTFSAAKSVSVLYALADPLVRGQIVEALDTSVDQAVGWLEREACFVRRGSNNRAGQRSGSAEFGTRRLPGAGFVAAGFRHRTSRAGDPQLHTHVLIANLSRGRDGRWSALDAQAVYRSRRAAGAVYDAAVRHELSRRLGVEWVVSQRGDGEIAGIPRRVLTLFSKRRNEIEAELERTGRTGPVAASHVTLDTRRGHLGVDGETLDARWLHEAATVGYGPADIDELLAATHPFVAAPLGEGQPIAVHVTDPGTGTIVERVVTVDDFGATVADELMERDSTFTRHQVTMTIAALLRQTCSTRSLERLTDIVLSQPHLVPLPDAADQPTGWEQRWTSRRLLDIETALTAMLAPTPGRCSRLDPAAVEAQLTRPSHAGLGSDQVDMVRRVTTQGLAVEVVVGRAGTGKTYAMAAVRALYTAAGYRLVGVAPSGLAARCLAEGAGITTFTFPRFTRRAAPHLNGRDVVVVDEAAMAGTVELHRVLDAARRGGAKVILVGDHHQLPEIAAGGGFAAAVAATAGYRAELTVNRRQSEQWEIDALAELRNGHVAAAFSAYRTHGRVVLHERIDDVHTAAIDDWWRAYRSGRDAVLLAGTRAETRALNRDGRAHAATDGLLHGPVLTVAERHLQAGDRVILTRNDADQHDLDQQRRCRVDNGMIGTITHVRPHTHTVDVELINGRRIRLNCAYLDAGHVDHGYAVTIHKAQGVTCDQVFVVGPCGLYRQAGYVAMSRARYGARIYATSHDAATLGERHHASGIRLPTEPVDNPESDLLQALETSHAKQLASTVAPHLTAIADTAARTPLDTLWSRHRHIRNVTRQLERSGHPNPAVERQRLATARAHRTRLHVGGRVRALDWDNVGTVTAIVDHTGTAYVHFTATDGRQTTRCMHWPDIKPIEHPDHPDLTDAAAGYFDLIEQTIDEDSVIWERLLAEHGIGVDEPAVVPAAIDQRQRQLAHDLAGHRPPWLTWWLGDRPSDAVGARVWDDEVAALAAWRDARHLTNNIPGYGPPPDTEHVERWRHHLQRSLDVRRWLHTHRPGIAPQPVAPLRAAEIDERLDELDRILTTAPPDQTRIIDALHNGELTAADVDTAIGEALDAQTARREWILEHWPHVIEYAELTRIRDRSGPADRSPRPLPPAAQHLYHQLAAMSTDTPEPRTLQTLDAELASADPRLHAQRLRHELAELDRIIRALHAERCAVAEHPNRAAHLNDHLAELHRRRTPLADQLDRHNAKAALWGTGHRPRDQRDAVTRRSNHLAHDAIANHHPWVIETVRLWHTNHPERSDPTGLHRLVVQIAAHRERYRHTGAEPLPPEPATTDPARDVWQRLRHQLTEKRTPPALTLGQ